MSRKESYKGISFFLIFSFVLFLVPNAAFAASSKGKLVGQVFAQDGTTPLKNVVIQLKHVSSDLSYRSAPTDAKGVFKIDNMEKGIYVFGVSTKQGDFNANELVGVEPNKTSKMAVALEAYDAKTAAAAQEVLKNKNDEGESLVGRVEAYNPDTKIATVYILRGFLQRDDRIHALGENTDFYQNAKSLVFEEKPIKRAYAGQTIFLLMDYDVEIGDLIYVDCDEGFFLWPLGLAALLGGGLIIDDKDPPDDVSPFKK